MNSSDFISPVVPDYESSCITELVPTLLEAEKEPGWISEDVLMARQVILLVLDGLGWRQLQSRISDLPTFKQFNGEASQAHASLAAWTVVGNVILNLDETFMCP